jgi:2'-5' RNA ligase
VTGPRPGATGARTYTAGSPDRRLFIAVSVPPDVRAAVAAVVEAAQRRSDGSRAVRWVLADGLHLTLRFLGATPPDRVELGADAVREAAASVRPFDVALGGAGAFPRDDGPRALWLGIAEGAVELGALTRAIDASLVRRGWPAEPRPFRAHLTLARSDDPVAGRAALAALRDVRATPVPGLARPWRPREVVLFESHLGRGPARYEVVAEGRIGG